MAVDAPRFIGFDAVGLTPGIEHCTSGDPVLAAFSLLGFEKNDSLGVVAGDRGDFAASRRQSPELQPVGLDRAGDLVASFRACPRLAESIAPCIAGNAMPARMARMAITTSSSMSVNAPNWRILEFLDLGMGIGAQRLGVNQMCGDG